MTNLAYNGFCPSCHNIWIFCDCVDSYGEIGEDLAQDEPEEQENESDSENMPDAFSSEYPEDPDDSESDINDYFSKNPWNNNSDVDEVLAPPPLDLPWGAHSTTGPITKPSYGPIISQIPDGKPSKPKAPRLPDDLNVGDPNFQEHVIPDFQDQSGLDDFLNDINDVYTNQTQYDPDDQNIADLHKRYSFNGVPENMRPSERGRVLDLHNLPLFTGPMYSEKPNNLTKDQKQSTQYLTQEYTDFLTGPLKQWSENIPTSVKTWWVVECQTTYPVEFGFTERVPIERNGRVVVDTGSGFQVKFPDGSTELYKTKMPLSQDFLFNTPKNILDAMTYTNSTYGDRQFKVEYLNGSPSVVTGQTRSSSYPRPIFRTVNGIIKVGKPSSLFSDGSGTWDRDQSLYRPLQTVPTTPSYNYVTNNNSNTKRLTGTGSIFNMFKAVYEAANATKFFTHTHSVNSVLGRCDVTTSVDNPGDAGYFAKVFVNNTNAQFQNRNLVLKFLYEMINFTNDPLYDVTRYGLFYVKFQALSISNGTYDIFITLADGSIYYPQIISTINSDNSLNTVLRAEGSSSTISFSRPTFGELIMACVVPNSINNNYLNTRVTPNDRCAVNIRLSGNMHLQIIETCQLVKSSTDFKSFQPTKDISIYAPEENVGVGNILPYDYRSFDNIPMDTVNYRNCWTMSHVWRLTSSSTNTGLTVYGLDQNDLQTDTFGIERITAFPNYQLVSTWITGSNTLNSALYAYDNVASWTWNSGAANVLPPPYDTNIKNRLASTILFSDFIDDPLSINPV